VLKYLLSLLLFFTVLIAPTFIPVGDMDSAAEIEIYLISNEIHTDLVLPVSNEVYDWHDFLNPADFGRAPTLWLEFGWGDKGFYMEVPTWDEFSWEIALKALFLPGPAVMHVNYLNQHPSIYTTHRRITISRGTYLKLINAIKGHFKQRDEKPIILISKGYTDSDNFYEAYGSFSILKTCNVWTSDVLGEVGLKRPLWSPTKYGLNLIWEAD
jgi:uncharacterized protein (TIGR02117 family)